MTSLREPRSEDPGIVELALAACLRAYEEGATFQRAVSVARLLLGAADAAGTGTDVRSSGERVLAPRG